MKCVISEKGSGFL